MVSEGAPNVDPDSQGGVAEWFEFAHFRSQS
jgi:hypothetical protein